MGRVTCWLVLGLAALAATGAAPRASVRPDGTRTVDVTVAGRVTALPDGSSAVRGRATTEDGRYELVTHNLARYHLPATQMDRGWMNTAALSVFDARDGRRLNTVLLDDPLEGAANPWGVAVNAKWIAVAHAGTHEVSLIPRAAFFEKLAAYRGEASSDLGFMRSVGRVRIPLKGKGPREVRFRADGKLEVGLRFAEATAVVDPETKAVDEPDLPEGLSDAVRKSPVRRGEHFFNDATVCFQKWQSCASCHPNGTTDGLTWDFPFSGGGLGHAEATPDLTKRRGRLMRRTRQGDFHILLYEASKAIGEDVDAYVGSLVSTDEIAGEQAEGKSK